MATKKQIAAVAKAQATVNKQIADLKKATAATKTTVNTSGAFSELPTKSTTPIVTTPTSYDPLADIGFTNAIKNNTPITTTTTPDRNIMPTTAPARGYEWKWLSLPGKPGTGTWKQYPIAGFDWGGKPTDDTAVPGSTGLAAGATRTLARDTFANTFALIFGAKEASQSYVGKLYDLVSGFYKTGSTVDDALNLAIRQAREENAIPEFTKRFAGIFALDEQFKAGKAISVPTIAEFFAAEAKMGEVLTNAGLGDLATQEFLGDVIGKGKSVLEVGNLISNTFKTIDDAPTALKTTLATYFPGVDRVSIARALLTGAEGAAALDKKIKGISVLSAAGSQGITTSLETASDIASQGYDYQQALTGFGTVNQLQRANELASLTGNKFSQAQAIAVTFAKNAEEKKNLERIISEEQARYQARSGIGQNALGANAKGAGLI